jgi:hypothetical protein
MKVSMVVIMLVFVAGLVVFLGERDNRRLDQSVKEAQASSEAYKKRWFAECEKSFTDRQCHLIACMKEPGQMDAVRP